MVKTDETAAAVAQQLLQIKAIILQPQKPFTWASGWKSPIYCDNRKTLSYPTVRTMIRQGLAAKILELYGKPDLIAGVATGGIAQAALVAQELGVGMIYVRSSSKKHGMGNQVEGAYEKGQNVVVIEDLVSTGMSSLNAVEALRESGLNVKGMLAIFTYGFDVATKAFADAKCQLSTLTNYEELIEQAVHKGYVSQNDQETLRTWRQDPSSWNQ